MSVAVVILSHGSVQSGAGEYLESHTVRLRQQFPELKIEIAFLNYGTPLLPETIEKLVCSHATQILIVPYFLVEGKFFLEDIQESFQRLQRLYSAVRFEMQSPIGNHTALEFAVELAVHEAAGQVTEKEEWGLVLLLHGSPHEQANKPAYDIVQRIQKLNEWRTVIAGHIDCNAPDIKGAIEICKMDFVQGIVVVPWFLHRGKHVVKDIPNELKECRRRYSDTPILLTEAVGKFDTVTTAMADRIRNGLTSIGKK